MEIDYVIIGKRIREIRKARGLTQEKLAEISGCEPSNISHIERAATKLSLPTIINIANALDVTLDELVYTNLNNSSHISVEIVNGLLSDCSPSELKAIADMIKSLKSVLRTFNSEH